MIGTLYIYVEYDYDFAFKIFAISSFIYASKIVLRNIGRN